MARGSICTSTFQQDLGRGPTEGVGCESPLQGQVLHTQGTPLLCRPCRLLRHSLVNCLGGILHTPQWKGSYLPGIRCLREGPLMSQCSNMLLTQ